MQTTSWQPHSQMSSTPDSDPQLLAAARRVLTDEGFRVLESRMSAPADAPWLLAENRYFILAVIAGRTLADLQVFEGYLVAALTERLDVPALGPKRWDAYAVLLASGSEDERGLPEVVELQYNTRSFRRFVCLGVSEPSVDDVLSPFFSLPDPPAGGLPSAFEELVNQLTVHGVDADRARSLVSDYQRTGGVSDD